RVQVDEALPGRRVSGQPQPFQKAHRGVEQEGHGLHPSGAGNRGPFANSRAAGNICQGPAFGASPEKSELAGLPGGAGAGRSKVGGAKPDKTTASSKEDVESGTAPDAEAPTPPPGPPTRRRPLTAVQPDLDRGGHGRVERRLLPAAVAQALQQPLRHVLQRP